MWFLKISEFWCQVFVFVIILSENIIDINFTHRDGKNVFLPKQESFFFFFFLLSSQSIWMVILKIPTISLWTLNTIKKWCQEKLFHISSKQNLHNAFQKNVVFLHQMQKKKKSVTTMKSILWIAALFIEIYMYIKSGTGVVSSRLRVIVIA